MLSLSCSCGWLLSTELKEQNDLAAHKRKRDNDKQPNPIPTKEFSKSMVSKSDDMLKKYAAEWKKKNPFYYTPLYAKSHRLYFDKPMYKTIWMQSKYSMLPVEVQCYFTKVLLDRQDFILAGLDVEGDIKDMRTARWYLQYETFLPQNTLHELKDYCNSVLEEYECLMAALINDDEFYKATDNVHYQALEVRNNSYKHLKMAIEHLLDQLETNHLTWEEQRCKWRENAKSYAQKHYARLNQVQNATERQNEEENKVINHANMG